MECKQKLSQKTNLDKPEKCRFIEKCKYERKFLSLLCRVMPLKLSHKKCEWMKCQRGSSCLGPPEGIAGAAAGRLRATEREVGDCSLLSEGQKGKYWREGGGCERWRGEKKKQMLQKYKQHIYAEDNQSIWTAYVACRFRFIAQAWGGINHRLE